MKLNASYKCSAYLAAGLPIIVRRGMAEGENVIRKNLGLIVDSLDEAVERVEHMEKEKYMKMLDDVGEFSQLIREGYFTKKLLVNAVFQVLYG